MYLLQVVLALSAFQKRSDREQPQRPCLKEKPMLSSAFFLTTPDSLLKAATRQTVRDILETLVIHGRLFVSVVNAFCSPWCSNLKVIT